ncbi:MAG: biotin/lipoyl-binding protein [Proteobacteria bacterium]|nr:biotin/lipoyl-binding protein [Pseudomonadota bacterium]
MFFRTKVLPVLSILGLFMAAKVVALNDKAPLTAAVVVEPARAPFEKFIAGAGIIEASSENIALSTQVSGVVSKVYVSPGQNIKVGDPLFEIDDRKARAELEVKRATAQVARADLLQQQKKLNLWQKVSDKRAISAEDLITRESAVSLADARLKSAENDVKALETEIERLLTRSPIDGEVLQVKIRVGEFAAAQVLASPLMVVGKVNPLNVRIDIDENDAWRFLKGAKAKAFVRGNPAISTDLQFVRLEPYVIPKRSLTGESVERVDTRVLQVIYSFEPSTFNAYIGQLVDVYIEAEK